MMKSAAYFEQLQQDFEAQNLGRTSWSDLPYQPSWGNLHDILALSRSAGSADHREAANKNPAMATELGKIMLAYGQDSTSPAFPTEKKYSCCADAEHLLIRTTDPDQVSNKGYISPVIVVKNDEPIAVIKGHVERTSYGLATDLSHGIMRGVFSEPPLAVLKRMREADHPFYLDTSEHGEATLLRIGGFLVPKPVREELLGEPDKSIPAAPTEIHRQIVARARKLLEDAKPLPPADEKSILSWEDAERERFMD